MTRFGTTPEDVQAYLAAQEGVLGPNIVGPFRVSALTRAAQGAVRCDLTASYLVSVDPRDPTARDVFVPVPIGGWAEFGRDGTLVATSLAPPDQTAVREARRFAQDLLSGGAVQGLPATRSLGPRPRPTHTLRAEAGGRRVLRRIGFTQTAGC